MSEKYDEIRRTTGQRYAQVAREASSGCCGTSSGSSCCGGSCSPSADDHAAAMGYSMAELRSIPEGANLALSCGNPTAIASLKPGEVVLDLGSGGGLDAFLAANQVGETGSVIGVDMTPDMIHLARENARVAGYENVEFRLGEIEHLPVPDASIDVILSNCVINLSPEKPKVFREAYRVLRHGGRLAISDTVAAAPLPDEIRNDLALHSACVAGTETVEVLESILHEVGFQDIRIQVKDDSRTFIREWVPGRSVDEYIVSATIEAVKK